MCALMAELLIQEFRSVVYRLDPLDLSGSSLPLNCYQWSFDHMTVGKQKTQADCRADGGNKPRN